MWSFGRDKKQNQALPPAESDLRRTLVADFQRARYGATCRTLAFPTQIDGETEYYRAVATNVEMDQWLVQRVVESPVQLVSNVMPVTTPSMKTTLAKGGIGFFDALAHLARFEFAQDEDPVGPSKDQLGQDHFYKLAMLHDIVFDVHGVPQPTIAGQAVINETYPMAVMDDLNAARGQGVLKKTLARAALSDAYVSTSKLPELFDRTKAAISNEASLRKAVGLIDAVRDLVEEIWSPKNDTLFLNGSARKDHYRRCFDSAGLPEVIAVYFWISSISEFGKRFPLLYEGSMKALKENENLSSQDRAVCQQFIKELVSLGVIQDAHKLLSSEMGSDDKKSAESVEKLLAFYAQINQGALVSKIAGPFLGDRFKALVMTHVRQYKVPESIQKFSTQMHDRMKQVTEERCNLQDTAMTSKARGPK
ncbi:hypothetical protein [Micavibrio aeruginosavorus]|uniref:hypothetical protein n=1 Tax=Micavibrio aeruginosavorus TaxID=349221 RepID=UPI003F4AED86